MSDSNENVAERSRPGRPGDRLPVSPAVEAARNALYAAARAMWSLTTTPVLADAPRRFEEAVDALIEEARREQR